MVFCSSLNILPLALKLLEMAKNFVFQTDGNKQGMRIAHLNIRGITSKIDEVKSILLEYKIDIFCLSETFLDLTKPSTFFKINNYDILRKDRVTGQGGGLLCFIRKGIPFQMINSLDPVIPESMTLKITQTNTLPFIICLLYRPPSTLVDWNQVFSQHVQQCSTLCSEIIVLGDFNVDLKNASASTRWIKSVITPLGLSQLIKDPTRVEERSSTLIDHLYTNNTNNIKYSFVEECSLSDHYMIVAVRKKGVTRSGERIRVTYNDYSRFTEENIHATFSNIDWQDLISSDDTNLLVESFNSIFLALASKLIQQRTRFVKSRTLPDWLDDNVKFHMKLRDRYKSQGLWDLYRTQRNKVTNLIRRNKKKHMTKLVEEAKGHNTKALWQALNITTGNKTTAGSSTADMSSHLLNEHFTTVAAKLSRNFLPVSDEDSNSQYLHPSISQFPPITKSALYKILKSIPVSKSTGPDNISVRMLISTFPHIGDVLTNIFNKILDMGVFPRAWKLARVTAIHKSGSLNNPGNYRPISVLPILSKMFERHVHQYVEQFLSKNRLISPMQSGFRQGHSCADAVHKVVADCLTKKHEHNKVILLFIDFCKAFDCVNHQILTKKLKKLKFDGSALALLTSFLNGRRQYVKFGDVSSSTLDINIGVPQGSILAPILFQIYINDLLEIKMFSNSYAYADDTVFLTSHTDPCALISVCNRDLVLIDEWCKNNHMTVNIDKSHFLFMGDSQQTYQLKIGNSFIGRRHETKLLGFKITDNLSWGKHCDDVLEKVSKNTNLLLLCRPYLTTYSAKLFYYQFIHCHLIYGIHIYYGLSPSTFSNCIFLQQKRALRIIANVNHIPYYLIRTNDLCSQLRILPLPSLNLYFTCLYGYKVLNHLSPQYISNLFASYESRFPKRDQKLLLIPLDSLNHAVSTKFNNLPFLLRATDKLRTFKTNLLKHIFQTI